MVQYIARRLLLAVPLLFGLSILAFAYVRVIPGDPVTAMLGVNSDPELVARLRDQLGLDEPWYQQYLSWLGNVLTGDFGLSYRSRMPVSDILVDRIPATLELALGGLLVGLLIAIPAGLYAGFRRGSRADNVITGATLVGLATPGFWLGTLLMLLLALQLGWLPSQGYVPFDVDPAQNLRLLVLPALTLGLAIAPYLARLTRTAVVETGGEPSVAYARAQGLPERTVARTVVLRISIPSLIVAVALTVGFLLAGSIIVEELFNWPGMGRLVAAGVSERDYPMIQALMLIYGVIFIVVNVIAEVLQGLMDPRVRLT
ncbi:ABC transporter permease [Jiangella muralis]|uniref:ABC transporter permease n=1 Tax=Jiangella muralis TaxID=702383 RepID=UPI00069F3CBD|nr:ABC transporter permease [Jiangella muralis]